MNSDSGTGLQSAMVEALFCLMTCLCFYFWVGIRTVVLIGIFNRFPLFFAMRRLSLFRDFSHIKQMSCLLSQKSGE